MRVEQRLTAPAARASYTVAFPTVRHVLPAHDPARVRVGVFVLIVLLDVEPSGNTRGRVGRQSCGPVQTDCFPKRFPSVPRRIQ